MRNKIYICPKCNNKLKETIYIKIEKPFCKKCNCKMIEINEYIQDIRDKKLIDNLLYDWGNGN